MARKITSLKARRIFKGRLLLGLVLKPLRLFCEHCDNYVPSDMEWRCGYCAEHNLFTKFYSFLNKCRVCKRAPKSYVCPHCTRANFLDKGQDGSHPARIMTGTGVAYVPTKEELRAQKREERSDQKDAVQHEIDIVRLNADLAKYKASAEFRDERTAMQKLEESFSEHDAHVMGIKKIVRRQRAANEVEFKNDPDGLKDANDSLDAWAEGEQL